MTCVECGNEILESEQSVDAGDGAQKHAHHDWPNGYPMSVPDVQRLNQFVDRHQKVTRNWWSGGLVDRVLDTVKHYEAATVNSLEMSKRFRDDMIVYLRALSLILEMVGNAGTHHEKEVRLRGCVSMIESGIENLRQQTFEVSSAWCRNPDLFRSDFPVRHYMDRVRELEFQIEKLTGKKPERTMVQAVEDETDAPF